MIGNLQTQPTLKKFVQVSEDASSPVHVPIFLGGECFIVTQQDVRKIQDERLLSYCKILPTGQLVPMESLGHDAHARDAIWQAFQQQQQLQQLIENQYGLDVKSLNLNQLVEYITRIRGGGIGTLQMHNLNIPAPASMELDEQQQISTNAASVEQQLQWSRVNNSSAPFPLHCSNGTSTTEICSYCPCCKQAKRQKANCCTRGCSTSDIDNDIGQEAGHVRFASTTGKSAHEQLKDRKMRSKTDLSYIS